MCIGRKGFIGWGWDSRPGKVVVASCIVIFTNTLQIKSNVTRLDLIASTYRQRWQVICLSSFVASVQMSKMVR